VHTDLVEPSAWSAAPKIFSYPQARRPITPSLPPKATVCCNAAKWRFGPEPDLPCPPAIQPRRPQRSTWVTLTWPSLIGMMRAWAQQRHRLLRFGGSPTVALRAKRFCALCASAALHRFADGGRRARCLHPTVVRASRIFREAFLLARSILARSITN